MPINPNIILQGRMADVGGALQQGIQAGGMLQQLQLQRAEAPLRQQLLEQQVTQQQNAIADAEERRQLVSGFNAYKESNSLVNAGDVGGALESLITRKSQLDAEGKDSSHTDGALQLLGAIEQGGEIGEQAKLRWNALGETLQGQMQLSGLAPKAVTATAGERERASLLRSLEGSLDEKGNFDPSKANAAQKSAAIDLGLIPSAGGTQAERAANNARLGGLIAEQKGRESEAAELGKARGTLKGAPLIAEAKSAIVSAVKLAESAATERGTNLTDVERLEATLPELTKVTERLKALSSVATYTTLGKAFDLASKEFGFGGTKGGTARARYGAIVSNQVLPLLKATFGSAFTVAEEEKLRATMGDIDSTPAAKQAELEEFINAKVRTLTSKKRQLGEQVQPVQQAQPNTMTINGVTVTRVQ